MQPVQRPEGKTIRVLVADDTQIHTQLLADALRRDPGLEVISPPSRSRDLVETVKLQAVDVIVLSSHLDEEPMHGFEVLTKLRSVQPGILAVMLLDSSKREAVVRAFRAGAKGIFSRHDSVETLSKCVRSLYQGQIWASNQEIAFAVEALEASPVVRAVDSNGLSLLSKRELQVVRSLAEGLTNREIAGRLGLSQHTIKNYLFRVYDKLGVSSRIELLFMTLTQPGSPQPAEVAQVADTPYDVDESAPKARRSSPNDSPSRGRNRLDLQQPGPHFPAAPVRPSQGELKSENPGSGESRAKFRPNTVVTSTDPLD